MKKASNINLASPCAGPSIGAGPILIK